MKVTVSEIRGDHLPIDGRASVTIHTRCGDRSSDCHIIAESPAALRQLAALLCQCADVFDQPYVSEAAE